jgi:lactoylglutathione lyase
MAQELHHFGITAADLDASVAFYTKYFDLTEVSRNDLSGDTISMAVEVPGADMTTVMLAGENCILEIIGYRTPTVRATDRGNADAGAAHACFVVEDIDGLHACLVADGIHISIAPQDFGETRFFFFKDPDGLSVEVLHLGANLPRAPRMMREAVADAD